MNSTNIDPPMRYSGLSSIEGGHFNRDLDCSGMVSVNGDLECRNLRVSGSTTFNASVSAHGTVTNSGLTNIRGHIVIDQDLKSSGSTSIDGNCTIHGNFDSSGMFHTKGYLLVDHNAVLSGSTQIWGNLTSFAGIKSHGITHVKGNVAAKNFVSWPFSVTLKIDFLKNLARSKIDGSLHIEENLEIRHIHIKGDILARRVKLGKNTRIEGKVYYVDSLEMEEDPELATAPEKISLDKFQAMIAVSFPISMTEPKARMTDTIPAAFCPQCGNQLTGQERFCSICGFNLK